MKSSATIRKHKRHVGGLSPEDCRIKSSTNKIIHDESVNLFPLSRDIIQVFDCPIVDALARQALYLGLMCIVRSCAQCSGFTGLRGGEVGVRARFNGPGPVLAPYMIWRPVQGICPIGPDEQEQT